MKNLVCLTFAIGALLIVSCEDDTEPFVYSVTISPENAILEVGQEQQFTAVLTDENGERVSGSVVWSLSNDTVASITDDGLASALAMGSTVITATVGGKSGNATLNVGIGSVLLTPSNVSILVGDTVQFSGITISVLGDTTENPNLTWESSDNTIFSLSQLSGNQTNAIALSAGNVTISATDSSGISGSASVIIEEVPSFNISVVDKESTGDNSQSQPELIRFISSTEGVIVNSKQNTVDFIALTSTDVSITGESINVTNDPDSECSSIDVSVDESIIAVVVSKGSCERGELYLIDVSTREKFGPYELGYNPDAVDIAVDNEFVVVVNEYDYEDGTAGCTTPFYPGVTIWDISQGLGNGTLVKHMKITHTGENGNLAEPEGVKIAPDGETVYMTLQESNQIGWFSILSPPDTLQDYISFTSGIHEPDGIWLNSDGTIVCTAGEYDGKIGITLLGPDGTPGNQYYANLADDLPSNWSWTDERKGIEPEEVVIVEKGDETFVLASLQDPAAVVVYNITNPTSPVYDSGEIVQLVDYTTVEGGEANGESEGLAYKNGYVLVSNTTDPSVCLLKASWAE